MLVSATVFDWFYNAGRWTWHDPDGYNFISGPLADITLLGGAYAIARHHNCHVKHCWRVGRHQVEGTSWIVCGKHHPHPHPTVEQIHKEHMAYKQAHEQEVAKQVAAAMAAQTAAATSPPAGPVAPAAVDKPPPHVPPG